MKLETFFKKFELFADSPNAVAKMRELILQLAVQGQLKSQGDESGFPQVRLDSLGSWAQGCGFPMAEQGHVDRPILFSKVSDMNLPGNEREILKTNNTIDEAAAKRLRIKVHPPGTVIFPKIGGAIATNKRRVLVRPTAIDNNCSGLIPNKSCSTHWIFLVLSAIDFAEYQSGTSVPAVNQGALGEIKVSLPPLAEQKRIVAKVDELMKLCDRLEGQQQEREEKHKALSRASLARFADAPTPANLQFIFHPSYTIAPADLRKSILTLAVQGKLVPQDPEDEPAEKLIARIAQHRRSKNAKDYSPVDSDAVPFEAPYSWSWVRLGNLSLSSDSGWSPQCGSESRTGDEWGVLKVSAVSWGGFDPDANKALPSGMEPRPECEVRPGDFLLSRANTEELVARSVVVEQTPPRLMMSDKIVRFMFPDEIEKAFINLANLSDPSREYYMRNASGTSSSMKNIGREVMCNLPVAIPPLAEQRRIVAKVEELMKLVDALETQLAASRATAANLLAALVAELTGTPNTAKASVPTNTTTGTGRRGRPPKS